jgi:hypothetical protein
MTCGALSRLSVKGARPAKLNAPDPSRLARRQLESIQT